MPQIQFKHLLIALLGASFLFGSGASEIVSPHLGLTGFGTLLVFLPILLVLLWGVWPKIARTYL
jgi:hypothetical protein